MTDLELMQALDRQLSHVWLVRTFLKHSEEMEESDELPEVVRELYDYCLAVGPALKNNDPVEYLKVARKKLSRLQRSVEQYEEILPNVSTHTNFKMALQSLRVAVEEIARLLAPAPAVP
ncbi:MAG: amidohydrolase [Planctomycetes bacterium]|nr:amidohydrolase [Planctomycetota bacterium]